MSYALDISDKLRPHLSGYRLLGYTDSLDQVETKTVLVWVEELTRPEVLDRSRVQIAARVQVVVGKQDPKTVDASLDDALDGVLDAISAAGTWLDWTSVERVIRADTFHAYTVHCTALATIGD